MPTTTVHKIKYPTGSVAPNVPVVMQDQADSVEAALIALSQADRRMLFRNGGYAWAGGNASWDAGTLSLDTTPSASSQLAVPTPTFATAGTLAGTVKFTEPGLYSVRWITQPSGEPGNAGYRIVPSGTWPGNPTAPDNVFGQASHTSGMYYWESVIDALSIRVPTAGLEVRLVGAQANATTNQARVIVTQLFKLP